MIKRNRTTFVSFEGAEGAGKTTAIQALKQRLEAGEGDEKVWAGRIEMPGQKFGEFQTVEEVLAYAEYFRHELENLKEYDIVLLDRAILSLFSQYVVAEKIISAEQLLAAMQDILGFLNIFVLETPVEICCERLKGQREIGWLRQFADSVSKAYEIVKPYSENRLQRFQESGQAVNYGYDLLFKPVHADISITDQCPLKCPFCVFRASERKSGLQMEKEQVYEIVDRCFDAGIEEIHLFGGEPLVWGEKLVELVEYIKERGGRCHILTSGFSTKHMDRLVELVDAVFISIDGSAETHAQTRGSSAVFPNAIKWLKAIQAAGKKPRIGTAVAKVNVGTAHLVPQVLVENGIKPTNVCFFHATPSGGRFAQGREHFDQFLSPVEWLEFQERIKALYSGKEWDWVHAQVSFSNKPEFAGCFLEQRKRWLSIMTNGDMYPCPNWVCASPVANILKQDPSEAIEITLSGNYLPKQGNGKDCWDKCLGGCPAFAQGHGDGKCDGRCGKVGGCLPEALKISSELLEQGYFPVCPNREVQVRNL